MSIKITCPSCDEVFSVADNMRGKKVACRECDKTILVPAGKTMVAGGDVDDDDKDKIRKGKPTKLAAAGAGRRFRDDDDDEDVDEVDEVEDEEEDEDADEDEDEGESKKKKKKSMAPLLLIGGGVVLAAAAAVVLIVVMSGRSSEGKTPTPNQQAQNPNPNPNPQPTPPEDTKREPENKEPKNDPKVEEPDPQPVATTPMNGEKIYQRLLKSTVWIVAELKGGIAGPGGFKPPLGPPTGPPQGPPQGGNQNELANSTWSGSENLKGYGKLEFQFGAGAQVTMIDKDGRTPGTYTKNGNSISLRFGGTITYTGTINGQTMSGNATNTKDNWTWSVTRQGGGGGTGVQPPGGFKPPGGFPMPPGGFPGGFPKPPDGVKPPGGFPMPPGGFPQFPGGNQGGGVKPMQYPGGQFPKPPGGLGFGGGFGGGQLPGQQIGGFPGQQIGGFPPNMQPPAGFMGGGKGPGGFPGPLPPGIGGKGPPGGGFPPGGKGPPGAKNPTAEGTGSLVNLKHRLVLTNVHVIDGAQSLVIRFPGYENGKLIALHDKYEKYPGINGKVVWADQKVDLALVQLERLPDGVRVLPIAKKAVRPAQQVHSMGNPAASTALWIYTPGKVRQVFHDKWPVMDFLGSKFECEAMKIETDSAINAGDSGGPLVDNRCVLVGVTHASNILAQNVSAFIEASEARTLMTNYFKSIGETWVPEPEPAAEEDIARIPELIKKLGHKEFGVRLNAVQTLASLGADASLAFGPLFNAMKDSEIVVKRAVSDALEKVPPHKGDVQMLCDASQNAQEPMEIRMQAVRCLGKLGPDGKSALPVLTQHIKNGDPPLRLPAFTAMIAIGPEVKDVPMLAESLKAADPEFRRLAAEALAKLGPLAKPAIPALLENLKSKDKSLRLVAMRGLEIIGKEAKDAITPLTELMQDADSEVAIAAAIALTKVGGDAKETIPFLRKALRTGSSELKKRAAQGLGDLRPQDKLTINDLIGALDDDVARGDAKAALVKIGKVAADPIASLMTTKVKNDAARLACIEAIGEIGHQSLAVGRALTIIVNSPLEVEANKRAAIQVWEKLTGKKVNLPGK